MDMRFTFQARRDVLFVVDREVKLHRVAPLRGATQVQVSDRRDQIVVDVLPRLSRRHTSRRRREPEFKATGQSHHYISVIVIPRKFGPYQWRGASVPVSKMYRQCRDEVCWYILSSYSLRDEVFGSVDLAMQQKREAKVARSVSARGEP